MINLNITKIQIEYLLFIKNYEGRKTITEASLFFNCSRANSKKILDKMILTGILYKEDNEYKLTKIGCDLSKFYNENLEKNLFVVQKFLDIDDDLARSISLEILSKRLIPYQEAMEKRYKSMILAKDIQGRERVQDISEYLEEGRHKINFSIKKIDEERKRSFVDNSMALMGFDDHAYLIIGEESYIELSTKTIKKAHHGYFKKAIATKLFYFDDGEEIEIDSKDRIFKIPLDLIDYWSTSDGIILEASLILKIKSQMGITIHSKKANFLFIVNLCLT